LIKNKKMVAHINQIIRELNDSVDEIYEGLMDGEPAEVLNALKRIEKISKDIKESIKNEM
jgi:thymidylate kinase